MVDEKIVEFIDFIFETIFDVALSESIVQLIGIAVVVLVVSTLYSFLRRLYRKKVNKQLDNPPEDSFELRYRPWVQALYVLISGKILYNFLNAFTDHFKRAIPSDLMVYIIFIILGGIFLFSVYLFIYRLLVKIVVDCGRMKLYVAGVEKVNGHISEIKVNYAFLNNRVEIFGIYVKYPRVIAASKICFDEYRMIPFSHLMYNSEKMVAYLIRKGLYDKVYSDVSEEIRDLLDKMLDEVDIE